MSKNKYKILGIVLLSFLGCSVNQKWQGTKEIRDSVTYIHNPKTGLWKDSKKLILKEVLSIEI